MEFGKRDFYFQNLFCDRFCIDLSSILQSQFSLGIMQRNIFKQGRGGGQVVSVLASTPTIRVRIPLTTTVFFVKFVLEKNKNKQKEAGIGPFKSIFNIIIKLINKIGYAIGLRIASFDPIFESRAYHLYLDCSRPMPLCRDRNFSIFVEMQASLGTYWDSLASVNDCLVIITMPILTACGVYPQTLSTVLPFTWQNKRQIQ